MMNTTDRILLYSLIIENLQRVHDCHNNMLIIDNFLRSNNNNVMTVVHPL